MPCSIFRLSAFGDVFQVLDPAQLAGRVGAEGQAQILGPHPDPVVDDAHEPRPTFLQIDAHLDLWDVYLGSRYHHGSQFRRAIEDGLLDPKRTVQIGLRGTMYDTEDRDFAEANGIRLILIEEFHARGVADVMAEAREIAGSGPTYVSYDIDFVDPTFAPGTGTPEVGGPNSFEALQVVRELEGLNIVGADMVEVSPPFDPSGGTAFLGVSIMFELLCVMAGKMGAGKMAAGA